MPELELRYFDNHFVKNTRKRGPAGKHFGVFSPRYSSNYILNRKLNAKINTIRGFLFKIRTLFLIFKKGQRRSPPALLVAHLPVWLNMH